MKTRRWTAMGTVAAGLMFVCAASAGDLTPPGAPGSTMHTLEEIYQKQLALEARLATVEQRMATDGMAPTVDGMVLIPAGPFQMGDVFSEGDSDELPLHTVTISAFYMDQYEVTDAQWDEVANWAATNGYDIAASGGDGKEDSHPVYNVTWYECVKWANARSEMEDRTPCYYIGAGTTTVYRAGTQDTQNDWVYWQADGYRLPTEAEWEKAARGGATARRFPWADVNLIDFYRANFYGAPTTYSYDTSLVSGNHPAFNTGAGTEPFTSPVGSFAPNGYGLYDMAGNVYEWCWDRHLSTYYAVSPDTDPHGPASGSNRVRRGGRWSSNADICRVANRISASPGHEFYVLGFRLVRAAQ